MEGTCLDFRDPIAVRLEYLECPLFTALFTALADNLTLSKYNLLRLDERLREDLSRVGSRGCAGMAAVVNQDMSQVCIEVGDVSLDKHRTRRLRNAGPVCCSMWLGPTTTSELFTLQTQGLVSNAAVRAVCQWFDLLCLAVGLRRPIGNLHERKAT